MPDPAEARSLPDQSVCVGCGQGPRKHGEGYCDRCWAPPQSFLIDQWEAECDRLRAENGRLKAALALISEMTCECTGFYRCGPCVQAAPAVAESALESDETGDTK